MYSSLAAFRNNIASVRELATLHDYLCANLKSPMTFDDLLRFQIVYSVSALDKLIHDIIRIGMVQTFIGSRPATSKYLAERISMGAYVNLSSATIPPKEYYFEQEIISKLGIVAYQSPDNIADGLSYIWDEKHKWQKIAAAMALKEDQARTQLKLIVDRRNKIAHEADVDITSGGKFAISKSDCESTVIFIEKCGEEIVKLVV
jgi:hypothetical protein